MDVQVQIRSGLRVLSIVGLPDKVASENRERVGRFGRFLAGSGPLKSFSSFLCHARRQSKARAKPGI